VIVSGHIFGLPIEETLESFGPVGAVGVGALVWVARDRAERARRICARIRHPSHPRRLPPDADRRADTK
jgi:hypothetical protein